MEKAFKHTFTDGTAIEVSETPKRDKVTITIHGANSVSLNSEEWAAHCGLRYSVSCNDTPEEVA